MARLDQIISHRFRGFAEHESTLEGALAALDYGVQQIEFDIRMTLCGTPIITHDEHARDGRGRKRKIESVMARDLPSLGGAFARMPTADALFGAIAAHANTSCRLLVDVKDAGFEEAIYALVGKHRLLDRTIWVSWLPEVLYAFHDIDADIPLCLSHWCERPGALTRSVHTVYTAKDNAIPRPERRRVHGERSGWFVDGPLRGQLREIVDWVCVPSSSVSRALVDDYHSDDTKLSAFSYKTLAAMDAAESKFGHDAYFSDAFEPFESVTAQSSRG